MHLREPTALGKPGVTYGFSGPFTKNKERVQIFKKTKKFKIYLSKRT